MNRRGFFSRVLAVLAVGPLARLLPAPKHVCDIYCAINRATFRFWRNEQIKRERYELRGEPMKINLTISDRDVLAPEVRAILRNSGIKI